MLLLATSCGKDTGGDSPDQEVTGCTTNCRIFVSASTANGAIGLQGFDDLCNADANKPTDGFTYKALLASTTRNKNSSDWPLKKSMAYYRPTGEMITTTDGDGVFSLPLQNTFAASNFQVRTGLLPPGMDINNTCVNWTSIAGIETSAYGETQYTDAKSYASASNLCSTSARIYCVEQ